MDLETEKAAKAHEGCRAIDRQIGRQIIDNRQINN
jgi:hypothetical protein